MLRFTPAIDAVTGEMYLPVTERGRQLLEEPLLNKGTAFTMEERDALELRGLLPAHCDTVEEQLSRVRDQYDAKATNLERHIYLAALHDRNETLFYRFALENLEEIVPIIYTPTVAEACAHWSQIFRTARGIYVTPQDAGSVPKVLRSRGLRDAAVIVITDNERILGIGDQGAGGMGIPIGKLALYTVAAGIHPSLCVPISLDVGTNNEELLSDPLYLGVRRPRLRGDEYWALVDEVVNGVREVFPNALLQWEDFANATSFRNLDTYRNVLPSFNDDIQGTAAMVVGGLLAASRLIERSLTDHTFVIAGAGSAGIGIARLLATFLSEAGMSQETIRTRIMVTDTTGLVIEGRPGLQERKLEVAAPSGMVADWNIGGDRITLADVVANAKPSVLIGVSGVCGLFDEKMVRDVGSHVDRPIIMPLSNPTKCTEATPADILEWTDGRALVATGSPFADVVHDGVRHQIGQANNMFIFPGMGLGVTVAKAKLVTPSMMTIAARELAECVPPERLAGGCLYPAMASARAVSHRVARVVAEQAVDDGVAEPIVDVEGVIERTMWQPAYLPYRPA